MPEETPEQIDQIIDEPINYVPAIASVIAILAVPAIYTRIVRKRRAREMPPEPRFPVRLPDVLSAVLQDPHPMYFHQN